MFLGAKKSPLSDWSLESVIFNTGIWLAAEVLRKRLHDHAFWLDKISGTLVTYHPTLFCKKNLTRFYFSLSENFTLAHILSSMPLPTEV